VRGAVSGLRCCSRLSGWIRKLSKPGLISGGRKTFSPSSNVRRRICAITWQHLPGGARGKNWHWAKAANVRVQNAERAQVIFELCRDYGVRAIILLQPFGHRWFLGGPFAAWRWGWPCWSSDWLGGVLAAIGPWCWPPASPSSFCARSGVTTTGRMTGGTSFTGRTARSAIGERPANFKKCCGGIYAQP
jgi:hypothetical protein